MPPPFSNSAEVSILRAPDRQRRFLIMVRCGSGVRPSFFSQPLRDDGDFDLACDYFAPPHADDLFHERAEYLMAGGLSKFHAAKRFLQAIGTDKYEGAWFLDDDIELHCDASEFLRFCADNGFAIAQPALTQASDSFWNITYQHPAFEYRLTNAATSRKARTTPICARSTSIASRR